MANSDRFVASNLVDELNDLRGHSVGRARRENVSGEDVLLGIFGITHRNQPARPDAELIEEPLDVIAINDTVVGRIEHNHGAAHFGGAGLSHEFDGCRHCKMPQR